VLKETGGFQILDGWEIFDAADQGMAEKVCLVVYDKGAIEIKTAMPGFSYINYAGTEKQYFMDQKTGIPTIFNTVPTQSYGKVYTMDPLPEIPPMDASGRIKRITTRVPLKNGSSISVKSSLTAPTIRLQKTWETESRMRSACRNILIAILKLENTFSIPTTLPAPKHHQGFCEPSLTNTLILAETQARIRLIFLPTGLWFRTSWTYTRNSFTNFTINLFLQAQPLASWVIFSRRPMGP